jgi:hypothetical protein
MALLGRRDTLQSNFVFGLKRNKIVLDVPNHLWTFDKNIAFIHSIIRSQKKIQCVIRRDYSCSPEVLQDLKTKINSLPLLKKELLAHEDFGDALLSDLYRDVQNGPSMLAIELNILLGFGYKLEKSQTKKNQEGEFIIINVQRCTKNKHNLLNLLVCFKD